jgi:hypothetical protein
MVNIETIKLNEDLKHFNLTMIPAPVISPIKKLGTSEAITIIRLSITEMEPKILRQKNT